MEGVGEGLRYPIVLWLPASADCRDELQVESLVSPGWLLLRDDLQYFKKGGRAWLDDPNIGKRVTIVGIRKVFGSVLCPDLGVFSSVGYIEIGRAHV